MHDKATGRRQQLHSGTAGLLKSCSKSRNERTLARILDQESPTAFTRGLVTEVKDGESNPQPGVGS